MSPAIGRRWGGRLRRGIRDSAGAAASRFRQRGRSAVAWMARLTVAAVGSFAVADQVFPHGVHLLAPLTAMLVVHATPVSILRTGIQRVASVIIGVVVAVSFSALVGLTWWSLAITIALSLMIGQALRLGSNELEVPISAMLVLGVNAATAESAAWQRITETLVGAGVGVLSNLIYPPKVSTADAAISIEGLALDVAALLESAADDLGDREASTTDRAELARSWLDRARRITHDIPNVGSALLQAEESRRLNVRALARSDFGPGLRQGMEALEHSAVSIRNLMRSFVEGMQSYDAEGRDLAGDLVDSVQEMFVLLADVLRAFGALVRAEAGALATTPAADEHRHAWERLRNRRTRLLEALPANPRDDPALAALTFFLLATVDRILQELDLDERERRRLTIIRPK